MTRGQAQLLFLAWLGPQNKDFLVAGTFSRTDREALGPAALFGWKQCQSQNPACLGAFRGGLFLHGLEKASMIAYSAQIAFFTYSMLRLCGISEPGALVTSRHPEPHVAWSEKALQKAWLQLVARMNGRDL